MQKLSARNMVSLKSMLEIPEKGIQKALFVPGVRGNDRPYVPATFRGEEFSILESLGAISIARKDRGGELAALDSALEFATWGYSQGYGSLRNPVVLVGRDFTASGAGLEQLCDFLAMAVDMEQRT